MKSIYWRPQKVSPLVLAMIAVVSIGGLVGLQTMTARNGDELTTEHVAARLAAEYMLAIKQERQRRGHPFDVRFDPHQTGMIGQPISNSTSKVANLADKQLTVNPNFAAVIVTMLQAAGVQPGDRVAVGWSGSFPALNVALSAAIETLDLQPTIVASALSSQYGANQDDFMWLDMEQHLARSGHIRFRSSAMTAGGAADRALGQSDDVRRVIDQLHERTNVPWLKATCLSESIDARMRLYHDAQHSSRPIKAYVNVGGGIASMGGTRGGEVLQPGVNARFRKLSALPDCVARRFAKLGVPVIHLGKARQLATRYQLNRDLTQPAVAGVSPLFERSRPSQVLAAALLGLIALLLHAFVSRDYGYRVLNALTRGRSLRATDACQESPTPVSQLMV